MGKPGKVTKLHEVNEQPDASQAPFEVTSELRAPICVMLQREVKLAARTLWLEVAGRSHRVTVTGATDYALTVAVVGGPTMSIERTRLSGPSLVQLVAAYGTADAPARAAGLQIAQALGMDEYARGVRRPAP